MHKNTREGHKRHIAGFTMAEMLIVVAIIGVLAAVSFIAVQTHQKSMTQLQYDTIAKEIFVAAQNHLTLAKSENYQQKSDLSTAMTAGFFGTKGDAGADTNDDIYYFTSTSSNAGTALGQILPFGAVELVTGGEYIIRYQPNAARVLDVFYWEDDKKYGISSMDYTTAVNTYRGTDKKSDRAKVGGNGVLGWCGGEDIVDSGEYLVAPEIEVINEEMLLVKVTDKNTDASVKDKTAPLIKLIVSGIKSEAKVAIPLVSTSSGYISNGDRVEYDNITSTYMVVLDSVTANGLHFSQLVNGIKTPADTLYNGKTFIYGENIVIQAVAYSNTVLTSVAYSGEWTTNSLFGEVVENTTGTGNTVTKTARSVKISNLRHLENLNDSVSNLVYSDPYFNNIIDAVQTVDLDWSTFIEKIKTMTGSTSVNIFDSNGVESKDDCFLPVSVDYTLKYNGQSNVEISEKTGTGDNVTTILKTFVENHSIKGIVVDLDDANANGGVFGALTGAQIKNLALIDTSVTLATSGNAGALAGTLTDTTAENVVSYHTQGKANTAKISTTSGSAGGLIGSIEGTTSITKSAAALIVESNGGDAGGLIGTSTATGTVSSCYSGGHTENGEYSDSDYNVTATDNAGGLIGNAGTTTITGCYTTCSVKGATVGGLVGTAAGTLTNCYCTGRVDGTTKGAFAGSMASAGAGCSYFEIINEQLDNVDYPYLWALGNTPDDNTSVTPFDESADTYNTFVDAPASWREAEVYDDGRSYYTVQKTKTDGTTEMVKMYYLGTSVFNASVNPVSTVTTPADFVATHYGDWPAPEIFVVNTK